MESALRLAWWNTGLARKPGGRNRKRALREDARIDVACDVVCDLVTSGIDVLAVGEVLNPVLEAFCSVTGYELAADPALDPEVGIGLLFNPKKVAAAFVRNASTALRNRDVTRALEFEVEMSSALPGITMLVAHWPSRKQFSATKLRTSLGAALQALVSNRIDRSDNEFVMVCGDFNDDPFDDSLTAGLYGTRDRRLALDQLRALYNPFWRLLGERKPFESPPPHHGAGTCLYSGDEETRWHTFDQFLFSSAFLRGRGWALVEAATEVWDRPPLSTDDGDIHTPFDHYPVVVGIRPVEAAVVGGRPITEGEQS